MTLDQLPGKVTVAKKNFYREFVSLTPAHVEKDIVEVVPKKPVLGKAFKKDSGRVQQRLSQMDEQEIADMEAKLTAG